MFALLKKIAAGAVGVRPYSGTGSLIALSPFDRDNAAMQVEHVIVRWINFARKVVPDVLCARKCMQQKVVLRK